MPSDSVSAQIYPAGMLTTLSRKEVERLHDASRGDLADLIRCCALAVLNSGSQGDDAEALLELYHDFEIEVEQGGKRTRHRRTINERTSSLVVKLPKRPTLVELAPLALAPPPTAVALPPLACALKPKAAVLLPLAR